VSVGCNGVHALQRDLDTRYRRIETNQDCRWRVEPNLFVTLTRAVGPSRPVGEIFDSYKRNGSSGK